MMLRTVLVSTNIHPQIIRDFSQECTQALKKITTQHISPTSVLESLYYTLSKKHRGIIMNSFLLTAHAKFEKLNTEQAKNLLEQSLDDIAFLLSLFDSLKQGVIIVDFDGKVRACNKMAEVMCGKSIAVNSFVKTYFQITL